MSSPTGDRDRGREAIARLKATNDSQEARRRDTPRQADRAARGVALWLVLAIALIACGLLFARLARGQEDTVVPAETASFAPSGALVPATSGAEHPVADFTPDVIAETPRPAEKVTPGQAAEIQVALAKAAETQTIWTKVTQFTGKRPWIWPTFFGAVLADFFLRWKYPNRKTRPPWADLALSIVALPAGNLWIFVRALAEGTASKFGYKIKLRLPDTDACPNELCPVGCASQLAPLPDPHATEPRP